MFSVCEPKRSCVLCIYGPGDLVCFVYMGPGDLVCFVYMDPCDLVCLLYMRFVILGVLWATLSVCGYLSVYGLRRSGMLSV